MGITINLFGGRKEVKDLSKEYPIRPYPVDKTGGFPCNAVTLIGLREGTIPGLQLASPLARPPITIPTSIVGIPTPQGSDDATQEVINNLVAENADAFINNTRTKCTVGTSWIWPRYDARAMKLIWEFIPDETIESIGMNPSTSEVLAIWTHEIFVVSTGDGMKEYSERKRKITPDRIDVHWLQKGTAGTYDDVSYVNVFHSMPIPFPHGADINQPRGHTMYGGNLRAYKCYHDVMLNACQILAEMQPKLNVSTDDPGAWLANNGFGTNKIEGMRLAEANFFASKLYLSKTGEDSKMIFLSSDALKGHLDMLDRLRTNIIIGSDSPEIFWPLLATGNMASTDTQKNNGVACIKALQTEDNSQYDLLFNKSLEILSFVDTKHYGSCKTTWGSFNLVSPESKATIFSTMAQGMSALMTSASVTLEDLFYFVKGVYPDLPETDAEKFIKGLTATAKQKAFSNSDVYGQTDTGNAEE